MSNISEVTDDYLQFNEEAIPREEGKEIPSPVENVVEYQEFEIKVYTYRLYKKQVKEP
jgi:hypothetical protein